MSAIVGNQPFGKSGIIDEFKSASITDSGGRVVKAGQPCFRAGRGSNYSHTGGDRIVFDTCLLYTSPSQRDKRQSRMPSSA